MILYNYYRSSASYRVRLALYFKQIPFEYRAIHLLKNEQKSNEFQKLNPLAQVPCLVDENVSLTQSMAIIEYLENKHSVPALIPDHGIKKYQIKEFCEIINCTQPLQNLSVLQFLENEFSCDQNKKQIWLTRWLDPSFIAIDKWLGQHAGQFCYQDHFTLADCFLLPQVFTAQRFHISLENYRHLNRLITNYPNCPWVNAAHPNNQPDTPK